MIPLASKPGGSPWIQRARLRNPSRWRCRRALFEAWVGIEAFAATLPPSLLRLDPTDVIGLVHDGRTYEFRLGQIADEVARRIEGVRQDRFAYDLPPGSSRAASLASPTTFGPPATFFLNLPQLADATPAYQPLIAADASPWPGSLALYRSPTTNGYGPPPSDWRNFL